MMGQIAAVVQPPAWEAILAGMRAGRPARLPEWPLRAPLDEFGTPENLLGWGLGYNVYHLPGTRLAVKVAMNRDARAMAESFIENQCESYHFWRSQMGECFMPPDVMFAYPHPEREGNRGCEIQMLVPGKPLWQITLGDLRGNPVLAARLHRMITGVLEVFARCRRLPDVVGCHASAPAGFRLQRSARLTSNIRLDEYDWPWVVDVGAWPRGFSIDMASFTRRLMIYKWAWELRLLRMQLARILDHNAAAWDEAQMDCGQR
jgi:hypothetical protein